MNALMTLTVIVLNVVKTAGDCPSSCECKWKSGKESVICVNANMTEIPRHLESGTQVLVLTGNRLQKIGADEFFNASLLNLQKIFLSRCKLRIIDRCSFRKIINLVELDLSYNDLHSVPSHTFEFIKELRELRLNGNPIVRLLNYAFRMVPRLTKLDLSECRIAYVEMKAFQGLENSLEWLKLDKNKIANVKPQALVSLSNLHGLELSGNSWNCTCGLRTLREWMQKKNVPYGVPPTCRHPPRLAGKIWDKLELDEFACSPRTETATSRKSGQEGSNVTLSCSVEGAPEPKVRWLRKNHAIANSSAPGTRRKLYVVRTAGRTTNLTILGADAQDNGVYVCRAENRAGRSEANVTLVVRAKPAVDIWSPRMMVAVGAVSLLFAAAICLLTCCAWSMGKRKSYFRHAATGRQPADVYEMKHKNPIAYNKIGDWGNCCSSDNLRGVAGRNPETEVKSRTAEANGESGFTDPVRARWPEKMDDAGQKFAGTSEADGGTSSPDISVPDGGETCGNSVGASEGDSSFRRSKTSSRIPENSAFFTLELPEKEKTFPDLMELSRIEENLINNNPFSTLPRKRSRNTSRGRCGSFGSESRSPLLPESSGDSWDSNSSYSGKTHFGRSPPPSPGGLSPTPILNILDGSFAESPTSLRCKSWELEMFLKEYRILQDQLYRMKESCENLREGNLKFRDGEVSSAAVESATISKMIPPVYHEEPSFRAGFLDDDDFSLYNRTDFLEEDNNNGTATKTPKTSNHVIGDCDAYWSGKNDFLETFPDSRNSYCKC